MRDFYFLLHQVIYTFRDNCLTYQYTYIPLYPVYQLRLWPRRNCCSASRTTKLASQASTANTYVQWYSRQWNRWFVKSSSSPQGNDNRIYVAV